MLQTLAKHVLAGAFDDKFRVLAEALEQAWNTVQESGATRAGGGYAETTQELLALHIIEIAAR